MSKIPASTAKNEAESSKPSKTKQLPIIKPKKAEKPKSKFSSPNVRAFLNQACSVANEIVSICGITTKAGNLLNDEELKNFKVATDLLTRARQLTIQAKQNAIEHKEVSSSTTNNLIAATSPEDLRSLLSAVNKHVPK